MAQVLDAGMKLGMCDQFSHMTFCSESSDLAGMRMSEPLWGVETEMIRRWCGV